MPNPASLLGSARDNASRGDIALHDHVCAIYETREDQYASACRFLKVGLERNEQCLYIAEHQSPAEFVSFLCTQGVNVKEAAANRSLLVLSGKEVRGTLEGFTPGAMFAFVAQCAKSAQESGFTAFRWAADMTWLRKDNIGVSDMFSFEAGLNILLAEHKLTALCQFAREDFGAEILVAAAETHPLLVYNDIVCDNFYYVPPDEYLNPQFSDVKLERMLYNIISRERFMHDKFSG